ncbi:hypothetical protein ACFC51_32570 [Streptomyces sp. NPDC055962]|uniref:hypothetical protein n=1 Tax=Streptomyces sp. NPDC055962 TaxID=3345667 RepID=UPI0035DB7C0B
MSVLPRSIPAKYTEQLRAALTAAGVAFEPTVKEGTRLTYDVVHQGVTWELRYTDPAGGLGLWKTTAPVPGYDWGPGRLTDEVADAITAPRPEPEPLPVDLYPGAPRTHLGIRVPEFVRAEYDPRTGRWSERARWWRLGVTTTCGELPDTRPR